MHHAAVGWIQYMYTPMVGGGFNAFTMAAWWEGAVGWIQCMHHAAWWEGSVGCFLSLMRSEKKVSVSPQVAQGRLYRVDYIG